MARSVRPLTLAIGLLLFIGVAMPATIAFFDNAVYTDPSRESPNLNASLAGLGHTMTVFSGIAAADWTAAVTGKNVLVIPELDSGDLNADLDAAARAAIASYVGAGGGLLMFDRTTSTPYTINLLNSVFGFSINSGLITATQFLNAAAAAGTPFAGGPASLPDSDATEGVDTASLPPGAPAIYEQGANASVFLATYGAGRIVFLGFDWFELPTPPDWNAVLGSAVSYASVSGPSPIPEPSSLLLVGPALFLALCVFRHRLGR